MAAAYQTGTASSPTNLLTTLVTWLAAQGWTTNMSASVGSGWRAHMSKGSQYVNLRAAMNESVWTYNSAAGYGLGLYLSDSYNGANAWNLQGTGPVQSGTSNMIGVGVFLPSGGVTAYHFFDDGNNNITIVVERTPINFGYLGWGPTLSASGFSGNFQYFFGSSPSYYNTALPPSSWPGSDVTANPPFSQYGEPSIDYNAVAFWQVDSTTFSGRWVSNAATTGTAAGYTGKFGRCAVNAGGVPSDTFAYPNYKLVRGVRSWQTNFPGALLLPLHCYVVMASGRYAPCGWPPTVFMCDAYGHGFGSAEIYAVGGINYMVFPGFAVKKLA
jgi:hypothetical protein